MRRDALFNASVRRRGLKWTGAVILMLASVWSGVGAVLHRDYAEEEACWIPGIAANCRFYKTTWGRES